MLGFGSGMLQINEDEDDDEEDDELHQQHRNRTKLFTVPLAVSQQGCWETLGDAP